MSSKPSTIAIDGPAASGKTTLAIALAKDLDYLYFDTGVMYRGVTLMALNGSSELPSEEKCIEIAEYTQIDVQPPSVNDGRLNDIWILGVDQTHAIRQPNVDANVSTVSAYAEVREALTKQQRRIADQGNVVMVGRDIGTVVLPEADTKIYLDASVEERAKRRYAECLKRGDNVTFEQVLASMSNRDKLDTSRLVAPLRPADDAVIINSDGKSAEEILSTVKALSTNHAYSPSK